MRIPKEGESLVVPRIERHARLIEVRTRTHVRIITRENSSLFVIGWRYSSRVKTVISFMDKP